jgi:type II secretory pathway component PulC
MFMTIGAGSNGFGAATGSKSAAAPPPGMQQMSLLRPSTPGGSTLVAKKVGVQTGLIASNLDKLPATRKPPLSKPLLVLHDDDEEESNAANTLGFSNVEMTTSNKVLVKPTKDAKVGVVTVTRLNEQGEEVGAQVTSVSDASLAAKAGLEAGHLLRKINGVLILRHQQFADAIQSAYGDVKLEVVEGLPLVEGESPAQPGDGINKGKGQKKQKEKEKKTNQSPPPPPSSVAPAAFDTVKREVVMNKQTVDTVLGIVAANVEEDATGKAGGGGGVEVKEVKDGGLASAAGLVPGDIIKRLNGLVVARHDMFTELIKSAVGEVKLELLSKKMRTEKASAPNAAASELVAPNPTIPYPHPATSPSLRRAS